MKNIVCEYLFKRQMLVDGICLVLNVSMNLPVHTYVTGENYNKWNAQSSNMKPNT